MRDWGMVETRCFINTAWPWTNPGLSRFEHDFLGLAATVVGELSTDGAINCEDTECMGHGDHAGFGWRGGLGRSG